MFPFAPNDEPGRVLHAQHAEHLRHKKAGHIQPAVFVQLGRGEEKKPQPIVSLNKAWKAACRAAGCPGRIPHDLRRTAARNLVRSGVSENVARQLTGHNTRSVFERYNITSGSDLRDAVARLNAAHRQASAPVAARR